MVVDDRLLTRIMARFGMQNSDVPIRPSADSIFGCRRPFEGRSTKNGWPVDCDLRETKMTNHPSCREGEKSPYPAVYTELSVVV